MPDRIYGPGQHIHAYKTRQEQLRRTMQELSGEELKARSVSEPISQGQMAPRQQERLEAHQKFVAEQDQLTSLRISADAEGEHSAQIVEGVVRIENLLKQSIEESGLLAEGSFNRLELTQNDLANVHRKTPRLLELVENLHTPTKEVE